jgi:hypothetical protein
MSEIEKNESTESEVDFHNVFTKQRFKEPAKAEEKKDIIPEKKESVKKIENVKDNPVSKSEEKEDLQDEPIKKDEEPAPKKLEEVDYKSELEKLQKSVKDTQKSFHENRKQLSAYRKAVEKMKEEGTLLDEEATMLLDHTKFQDQSEEEPLFVKYGKIWDKELPYMKKYAPNAKELDQHILAFQHFIQTASPEEVNEVLSELSQYEEDETEFTHQMLEIGRQYNEDIYADIHDAGSIRKLKNKYSEKEAELQKKIDKLEKQYNKLKEKYEDYNPEPANLRLPTGSGNNTSLPKDVSFEPAAIFKSRFQHR